jgi:hypothetical protein
MASANPSNSTIAHMQTSIDADSPGLKEVWAMHYCRSAWWIAQIALLGHFDALMRRYVTAIVELRGKNLSKHYNCGVRAAHSSPHAHELKDALLHDPCCEIYIPWKLDIMEWKDAFEATTFAIVEKGTPR